MNSSLLLPTALLLALSASGGSADVYDDIVGTPCTKIHINTALYAPTYKICLLCPHSAKEKSGKAKCKDGYKRTRAGGCGTWKTKCEWTCTYVGKETMNYGCGCGAGRGCHDVDCEMSKWSEWSACVFKWGSEKIDICEASVDVGMQTRTRSIVTQPKYNGKQCGKTLDTRYCSCPATTKPTPSPTLSPTLRPTRSPTNEDEWECQEYGQWSEWTECIRSTTSSKNRGKCWGDRTRTRPVRDTSTVKCRKTATQRDPDFCIVDGCEE